MIASVRENKVCLLSCKTTGLLTKPVNCFVTRFILAICYHFPEVFIFDTVVEIGEFTKKAINKMKCFPNVGKTKETSWKMRTVLHCADIA